jgi:hypothetical protein
LTGVPGFSLFSSVAERFTRNEQVGNSILPRGLTTRDVGFFWGEVAKRSNALGSGPSPSGSRVRFSPSSLFGFPLWFQVFRAISGQFQGIFRAISGFQGNFRAFSGFQGIFRAISGFQGILAIFARFCCEW